MSVWDDGEDRVYLEEWILLVTSETIFQTSVRLNLQINLSESRAAFHFLSIWVYLRQAMSKLQDQQRFLIMDYIQACNLLLSPPIFWSPWEGNAGNYSLCRFPTEQDCTKNP